MENSIWRKRKTSNQPITESCEYIIKRIKCSQHCPYGVKKYHVVKDREDNLQKH